MMVLYVDKKDGENYTHLVSLKNSLKEGVHQSKDTELKKASELVIQRAPIPVTKKMEIFEVGYRRMKKITKFKLKPYRLPLILFIMSCCQISTDIRDARFSSDEWQAFICQQIGIDVADNRFDSEGNPKKYNYKYRTPRY